MPSAECRCCLYDDTIYRTQVFLVHLFSVLPEKRSARLLVQEHVAGLAQKHKPRLVQVLVVSSELVMNV